MQGAKNSTLFFVVVFFTVVRLTVCSKSVKGYELQLQNQRLPQGEANVKAKENDSNVQPYFLPSSARNVTTTVGQNAYLHCRISSLGDEAQVSWIRKRDLHVLSSGKIVFSTDQRFQVIHPEKSENWTLQIKYSQLRDSGIYECQVNTVPKISMAFTLNVVDSRAEIQGPEYVKAGSTINLTCTISQPSMKGLVYWYRNGEMLDYESQVNIITKSSIQSTSSQLTITNAQTTHSGNYTCWPTLAKPTSVLINVVLEGEQPAAMQTGASHRATWSPILPTLIVCLPLLEAYLNCFQLKQFLPFTR
ncbi:UNVERIFIED_CONTAM: hypothetical protein RMT77_003553 [Armadillidium vulgare]